MEAAAIRLAAAAVSPVIAKLGAAAASYFGGDITRAELDQLQNVILPKISTVIQQAERIDAATLSPWLAKLQAAAYEAEDVLDMHEYNCIKRQVCPPASLKKVKGKAKTIFAPVLPKTEMKRSFEKLKQSADEAVAELIPLLNLVNSTSAQAAITTVRQPQRTTVSGLSSPVFGRDEERSALVNMLTAEPRVSGGNSNVILHAIHGIGGAGKTTLAQSVFDDERVQGRFDLKIWVHVSRTFDPLIITKDIIARVEIGSSSDPVGSLDVLQRKLKEALMSTRFLLVLDDVWTEEVESWDQLLVPLHQGGKVGSRILITTRMERTVLISRARDENIVSLDDLPIEQCRSIFNYYAFDDPYKVIEDPELADICETALFKLKNSPLAARLAGSLVRKTACTAGAWRRILGADVLGGTMDVIMSSFQHLPPHLQRCFSICSLYEKGHCYDDSHDIDELVRLWIAHGYVEAAGDELLEDTGRRYFDDLSSYSLFQRHPTWKFRYAMHDLVHDVAERVSRNYCFRIEGDDPVDIPPTVIHLSVVRGTLGPHVANIMQLRNLRTFLLSPLVSDPSVDDEFGNINKQLAVTMFEKLTKLQVLHLEWFNSEQILCRVDKLKLLRDLVMRVEKELPESVGTLYHLQHIHLSFSYDFSVPKSLNNLWKLRHVFSDQLCSEIDDIGKLTSLRKFKLYGANRTKRCGLQQLENLQHIRGRLEIEGLEFVKDKAGATIANLNKKGRLEELILKWDFSRAADVNPDTAEAVLEGLEPHPDLKRLEIWSYNGAKPPGWMLNDRRGWLPNLTSLVLGHCRNLTAVPNLPCRLRELAVGSCPKLMQLYPLPCGLEVLVLVDWPGTGAFLSEQQQQHSSSHKPFALRSLTIGSDRVLGENTLNDFLMNKFPFLSEVELKHSPSIKSLRLGPYLTALEDLSVVGLENLRSVKFMGSLTSIKRLTVTECPELTATAGAGGGEIDNANRLPSFEGELKIDDPSLLLVLLQERDLNSLVQLKISTLQNGPFSAKQESIFQLLTSLRQLSFDSCPRLPSLPGTLEKLSSLERLEIRDCSNIWILPTLPSSLKSLTIIWGCDQLVANYKVGGPLRRRISHIPEINIR